MALLIKSRDSFYKYVLIHSSIQTSSTHRGASVGWIVGREEAVDELHLDVDVVEDVLSACVDHVAVTLIRAVLTSEGPAFS